MNVANERRRRRRHLAGASILSASLVASGVLLSATTGAWATQASSATPGRVLVSGVNDQGQLGLGSRSAGGYGHALGLADVVSVAAGTNTAYALTATGSMYAWGDDYGDSVGDGPPPADYYPQADVLEPTALGLQDVAAIGTAGGAGFAVHRDGGVSSWGDNFYGELGSGSSERSQASPARIPGLSGVKAMLPSAGRTAFALMNDGTLTGWGYNGGAMLGSAAPGQEAVTTPTPLPVLRDVVSGAVSMFGGLAVTADGVAWSWGPGLSGERGDGTQQGQGNPDPAPIPGLRDVQKIVASYDSAWALKRDGTVWAWGAAVLCPGGTAGSTVPVQVPGVSGVVDIGSTTGTQSALTYARHGDGGLTAMSWDHEQPETLLVQDASQDGMTGTAAPIGGDRWLMLIDTTAPEPSEPTAEPTSATSTPATPQPSIQPTAVPAALIERLAGPERLGTAISISRDAWGNQEARSVVLARSDSFPDALAGTPLAVRRNAPLLLTPPSTLNSNVANEINRVLPAGRTVYLLGGSAAISPSVGDAVTRLGYRVVRLSGPDRYATAVTISKQLGTPSTIFLATGMSFQNALISGVAAANNNGVVVLTADGKMPASTRAYLDSLGSVERVAVGPHASAAAPGATAVSGGSIYETSRLLAERYFRAPKGAALASGNVFADALAGGAHISRLGGPLLLSEPTNLPVPIKGYLSSNRSSIDTVTLYGGTAALSSEVEDAARYYLGP